MDPTAVEERRSSQRILMEPPGQYRFWLSWYGGKVALRDLSVEGFSMNVPAPPASARPFEFLLEREATLGGVSGVAQVVNFSHDDHGGLAGCRFIDVASSGRGKLTEWLAGHVLGTASVKVSEGDAEDIVLGPSII